MPNGTTSNASHAKTSGTTSNASHAKTSTPAPAWSAQSLLQTLHPDARGTAQLTGLAHHPELNGRTVKVMGQDKPSGLVIVQLQGGQASGKAFKVAAGHLMNRTAEEPNAKIVGMVKDKTLNGLPVQVLGFDKQTGRFVVKLPDGSMRKVTEEHLASPQESAADSAPEEATLVGMTKDQSLNGQVVQVLAFDEKSGRYVVKLPDGSERKVKKDHLASAPGQDVARLVGMTKDRSLNGQEVHVLGFDKDTGRYVVQLPDGSKRKVKEEHLEDVSAPQEEQGQQARLTGMTKDKSLNGQLVRVLGVDKDSGRFVVKLPDGHMRKVQEAHIQDVDTDTHVAAAPTEVSAILEREGAKAERVEVLGFDEESSRFLVANASGKEMLADLSSLDGLTNLTARSLTSMVIAGKNAAPLPQLTICNTYPSRAGLTVVLRHTPNHTDDLLVGSNLPFSTCRDLEFPVARGTLVFLRGRMQVGEYPFLVKPRPTREILLVHRADKDSEGCAVMRSVVQAKPKPGQVIVMNAASGFDLIGLAATFGGAHHPLQFNQLYDLQPGHYDLSLTAPNTRLAAGLDVSAGKTYVVAATGVAQGLHGEPTPVGLFIHGVDSFDVAEASPVTSTPRPHSLPPQVFLQVHSAAALAATLLLLGLLES